MSTRVSVFCFVIASLVLLSCNFLDAGTHGSVISYTYSVNKGVLQNAVYQVITTNPNVQRIDTVQKDFIIDITNNRSDTVRTENHFNDGFRYLGIKVKNGYGEYEYTFQFTGSKENWDTSRNSNISIAYAYDENGKGGSDGNGDFPWYRYYLRKKLVRVFEQEFICKIDSLLGMKHIVE